MSGNTCDGTPSWPDPQTAELVRLRERVAELSAQATDMTEYASTQLVLVACLEQKLAAAERDAARYRYLRDTTLGPLSRPTICIVAWDGLAIRLGKDEADKQVDAAMRFDNGGSEGQS